MLTDKVHAQNFSLIMEKKRKRQVTGRDLELNTGTGTIFAISVGILGQDAGQCCYFIGSLNTLHSDESCLKILTSLLFVRFGFLRRPVYTSFLLLLFNFLHAFLRQNNRSSWIEDALLSHELLLQLDIYFLFNFDLNFSQGLKLFSFNFTELGTTICGSDLQNF